MKTKIELKRVYDELAEFFNAKGSALVAFSGGVDSSLLAKVASEVLGKRAKIVILVSPLLPKREIENARLLCKEIGVDLDEVQITEEILDIIKDNPSDRCYICKSQLFRRLKKIAEDYNLDCVVDGTNADDTDDFRPGMRALKELGIVSPFKELGIDKGTIRELSQMLGLRTWDMPSLACLASRIPFKEEINSEKLIRIDKCEEILLKMGFTQFRVRCHGKLARIEVEEQQLDKLIENRTEIIARFKEYGFKYVTLDIECYRVGSLNEMLTKKEMEKALGEER